MIIIGNAVLGIIGWLLLGKVGQLIWNCCWPKTYSESISYVSGPLVFTQILTTYPWLREGTDSTNGELKQHENQSDNT